MFRLAETADTVTTNGTLYANVPFGQVPDNGFYYLANWFGVGSLVNGVDYTHRMTTRASLFPKDAVVEWSFPASGGTGLGTFAYGWPVVTYGDSDFGNPYNVVGPWPMKINALTRLNATYDITLGQNAANSIDMLIDSFVTASPTSTDGSYVAELSVFPYFKSMNLTNGLSSVTVHTFASFGEAKVGIQGQQICVFPTSGGGTTPRSALVATVDLKEIYQYLVAQGLGGMTGNEYVRGIEIGPEVQIPNASYNSGPFAGFVRYNALSYDWA